MSLLFDMRGDFVCENFHKGFPLTLSQRRDPKTTISLITKPQVIEYRNLYRSAERQWAC